MSRFYTSAFWTQRLCATKNKQGKNYTFMNIKNCYMVVDWFKGTDRATKPMSYCATQTQWDIQIVARLNPLVGLWRRELRV